jgi:hypothetical protein
MAGIGRLHLELLGPSTLCTVLKSDERRSTKENMAKHWTWPKSRHASTLPRISGINASATGQGGPNELAETAALGPVIRVVVVMGSSTWFFSFIVKHSLLHLVCVPSSLSLAVEKVTVLYACICDSNVRIYVYIARSHLRAVSDLCSKDRQG